MASCVALGRCYLPHDSRPLEWRRRKRSVCVPVLAGAESGVRETIVGDLNGLPVDRPNATGPALSVCRMTEGSHAGLGCRLRGG
jgi:hypothetical protein